MKQSGMPFSWWPASIKYFAHALNIQKPKALPKREPWFLRHKKAFPAPLIPFGCLVTYLPKSPNMELSKFESRARTGVFIGYHLQDGCKYRNEMLVSDLLRFADKDSPNPIMRIHEREVFFNKENVVFPLAIARKEWEDKQIAKALTEGGPEPEFENLDEDQGAPQGLIEDEDQVTILEPGEGTSESSNSGEQPVIKRRWEVPKEPPESKTEKSGEQPQLLNPKKEKLPTGNVGRPATNKPGDIPYEKWKNLSKAQREKETERWRKQEAKKAEESKQNFAQSTILGTPIRQHVVEASVSKGPDDAETTVGALVCSVSNADRLLVEFACSDDSMLCNVASECGSKTLRLSRKFADLKTAKGLKLVCAALAKFSPELHVDIFASLPCTPWCQWHHINEKKIEGFSEKLALQRRDSFAMLANLVRLVAFVKNRFRSFSVSKEWPKSATGWIEKKVIKALKAMGLRFEEVIHGCSFDVQNSKGDYLLKPWLIKSTSEQLCTSLIPFKCNREHKHAKTEGSATKPTGFYNRKMATTLLKGLGYEINEVTTIAVAENRSHKVVQ